MAGKQSNQVIFFAFGLEGRTVTCHFGCTFSNSDILVRITMRDFSINWNSRLFRLLIRKLFLLIRMKSR